MNSFILIFFLAALVALTHGLATRTTRVRSYLLMKSDMTPMSPQQLSRKFLSAAAGPAFAAMVGAQVAFAAQKTYLIEPTEEFVDEEKKVASFNAVQLKIRKEWDALIAKLEAASEPAELEKAIKDLKAILVKYDSGTPMGVKKIDLVKLCRSKKFVPNTGKKIRYKPEWTTEVEIAYQELILEFNHQFLPKPDSARDRSI